MTCWIDLEHSLNLLREHRILLTHPDFEVSEEDYSLDEVSKRTFLIANKVDLDEDGIRLDFLKQAFGDKYPIYPVNATTGDGVACLEADLFHSLKLLRVYTKTPGHPADMGDPIILSTPATVEHAAFKIHKDFAQRLAFAKIWGKGKFDGSHVHNDFHLSDGDILEFHLK